MSQRIIGSNTLVQGALPTILANTPKSFFDDTINVIQNNAKLAFTKLRGIPGLMPVMPQGAMYMMVRIDRSMFPGFKSDLQFVERLVAEQSVSVYQESASTIQTTSGSFSPFRHLCFKKLAKG